MNEEISLRFNGLARLYGEQGLDQLMHSHVTVIGLGGVGSWAAEALARTAVGELTLIDMDEVCVSNTNRQLHALDANVGRAKVDVLAERIKQINPQCRVNKVFEFISPDNQQQLLANRPDFVLDAIDSVAAKVALIAFCKRQKIKVVSVGGAGGQVDPLKITVADLSRTWNDPLAAKVRSELRRNYGFSSNPKRRFGVECVFSTEQLRYPKGDGSVCQQKRFPEGTVKLDCSGGLGASVQVTATFGLVAASRIVNKITAS